MTTITLETVAEELRAIREFMAGIGDRRLSRADMAKRLGISTVTLDRRIKSGTVLAPTNGKWPLSEVIEWEKSEKRRNL